MNLGKHYAEVTACRFCNYDKLFPYLDLGNHPPSNSFISSENLSTEVFYPLKVLLCENCSASQLSCVVPPEDIFSEYDYLSSTSKALQNHFQVLVDKIIQVGRFSGTVIALDIGANDGIILDRYPGNDSYKLIGVEPSTAGRIAQEKGYHIYPNFFDEQVVKRILKDFGKTDVITATNVFAHIHDVLSVVKNVSSLLSDEGLFVLEFPYTPTTFDSMYFDTIYHEHLSYLNLNCLNTLLEKTDLRIVDFSMVEVGASGPAIQVFIAKENGLYKVQPCVYELLQYEKEWGVFKREKYLDFANRVSEIKSQVLGLIDSILMSGEKIAAFSAPAKGNTLLNYLGLNCEKISCIAETNIRKIGKLAPGSHIPIVDEQDFLRRGFSYALLLSWNYLDFFLNNSDFIKQGGKFIVPLPKSKIFG
jgi:hypothetical protein